jgi:hypothetical protein
MRVEIPPDGPAGFRRCGIRNEGKSGAVPRPGACHLSEVHSIRERKVGGAPCYHLVMGAKPFMIVKRPGAPLSVAETAKKYGLSRSAAKDIEVFVRDMVSDRGSASRHRMGSRKAVGGRRRSTRAAGHR